MSASEESKESNEPKAMATDEGEEVRISEKSVANQLNFFLLIHHLFAFQEKSMTMISVHVKTPKDKKTISIGDKANVKDVSSDFQTIND